MSTRSIIAMKTKENTIKGIYCHFDGYLEHNGKYLINSYNNYEKVLELINLGDISSLNESIENSIFYGRDREEKNTNCFEVSFKEFNKMCQNNWCGVEYIYFFTPNRKGEYRWLYKQNTYKTKPTYETVFGKKYLISKETIYFTTKFRELNEMEIQLESLAVACYITGLKQCKDNPEYREYYELSKTILPHQLKKAREIDNNLSRFQTINYLRDVLK